MKITLPLLLATTSLTLCACATTAPEALVPLTPLAPAPVAEAPPPAPAPAYPPFGFDIAGMDPSASPGDSFFRYANGKWVDSTEIPADRSSYNTFTMLREKADQRTRELIQTAAANPTNDDERRVGTYFNSFMDEAAIEAAGTAPLKSQLDAIAAIGDRQALARALGGSIRADVDLLNATDTYTDRLFGVWIAPDMKRAAEYTPYLVQGGLGMPDRDYYLSDNPKFAELRKTYQAHIARMMQLAGFTDVEARAKRVMALETAIAKAHASALDSNDVEKGYNPWTRADFARKAPGIDWNTFFDAAGLGAQQTIVAWQPSAVAGVGKLAASQPLSAWKDYLAFREIERSAPFLPKAFVDENFALESALSGTPSLSPRWKRGVAQTNAAMGEAVGKLYVARYFPPEAKAELQTMARNVIAALGSRIQAAEWMTPQTKARAQAKLATTIVGVGYPDTWRDYSALQVTAGDPVGNVRRSELFHMAGELAKLGRPVDRSEWFMTPQTVNALNVPQGNGIFFPAAILEPPFFDPNADPAVNYGAIGAVMGHEISHSFDDTGALFDETGALSNWWTPEDFKRFKAAGAALAAQYDTYKPLPDVGVNGELTLGENIADVAGLAAAYDAWKLSLSGHEAPVIAGFTGDQRFFLGWAQNYRSKYREAALRRALLTDVHSPGEFRSLTVRNIDAWYGAFDVKPGQALYLAPEDRVRVW